MIEVNQARCRRPDGNPRRQGQEMIKAAIALVDDDMLASDPADGFQPPLGEFQHVPRRQVAAVIGRGSDAGTHGESQLPATDFHLPCRHGLADS